MNDRLEQLVQTILYRSTYPMNGAPALHLSVERVNGKLEWSVQGSKIGCGVKKTWSTLEEAIEGAFSEQDRTLRNEVANAKRTLDAQIKQLNGLVFLGPKPKKRSR